MHTRYYAQRQHLISSFDSLTQQLFTLSFLMSPSVFIYLSRVLVQMQCARPREFNQAYPLRFFYGTLLFCNAIILWIHALHGAPEGRTLLIDFIGMSYVPSRLQLLSLDLFIMFLQLLTTTISYETQLYYTSSEMDTTDVLLPATSPLSTPTGDYSPLALNSRPSSPSNSDTPEASIPKDSRRDPTPCIIDLQLSPIISRLRNPAPTVSTQPDSLLPLPNTSSLPIPAGLRMLMRANIRTRRERATGGNDGDATRGTPGTSGVETAGRIPGGLG